MSDYKREIRLKYQSMCSVCQIVLSKNTKAIWDYNTKTASCISHSQSIDQGTPGASADKEYIKRKKRYENSVRKNHPFLGDLLLKINNEPNSVSSWSKGSHGEKILGKKLNDLQVEHKIFVLHDRKIRGTKANIDHIVVAECGVFVIDAKNYKGKIHVDSSGGFFSEATQVLRVGKRNCTKLVESTNKQVSLVRNVLEKSVFNKVEVFGMIAFTEAEWPWFDRPTKIENITLNGYGVEPFLTKKGNLTEKDRKTIAELLSSAFPPATS